MGEITRLLNEQPELFLAKAQIAAVCINIASELNFDFDDLVSLEAFVDQILFCYLKDAFTDKLPRTSLLRFGEEDLLIKGKKYETQETERVKRTRKRVVERKKRDYSRLGIQESGYLEQLENLPSRLGGRFSGYGYNDLDYQAVKNTSQKLGLRIIAYLKDGRILFSKKVSGDQIETAYTQYREYLKLQSKTVNHDQWLYNLFDVASMEGSLCISLIYYMACYMNDKNLDTLPEQVLYLCGLYKLPFGGLAVQSRFLALRDSMISFVCESPKDKVQTYFERRLLPLHAKTLQAVRANQEMCAAIDTIPTEQLVTEFQKTYNLFDFSNMLFKTSNSFTSSAFISRLREAARIIIDPQLYTHFKKPEGSRDCPHDYDREK